MAELVEEFDVTQRSPLARNRCSALRVTGNLCGAPVMQGAPFPICERHAAKLYDFMLEKYPPRSPTAAEQKLEMLERAREEVAEADRKARALYAAQSQVYYLRIHDYIKIGYTQNIRLRMGQLRVDDVDALLATEPGGYKLESQRHREFAAERIGRRENFNPSPRLLAHIDQVRAQHGDPVITSYVSIHD